MGMGLHMLTEMLKDVVGEAYGAPRRWSLALLPLLLLLAACGDTFGAPSGPFASPQPRAPQDVAARGCGAGSTPGAGDVELVRTAAIRQGTELQRVADDLSGAVPGGNLRTDTALAVANAQALRILIGGSNLCLAVRQRLLPQADGLAGVDGEMEAAARSGGDVKGSLAKARAVYDALVAAFQGTGGGG